MYEGTSYKCLPSHSTVTEKSIGFNTIERRRSLSDHFHLQHTMIVGIQEARSKSGRFATDNFQVISSGHLNHNYGCELWIANKFTFNKLYKTCVFTINQQSIAPVYSSPRILAVCVKFGCHALNCIVWHAPHSVATRTDISKHWHELHTAYNLLNKQYDTIGFCDANATVGSVQSSSIGDVGMQNQDFSGGLFHEFLQQYSLYLPSTFNHLNHHNTYSSKRIDYIVLPLSWQKHDTSSYTSEPIEQQCSKVEHCPVFSSTSFQSMPNTDSKWISQRNKFCNISNFDITTVSDSVTPWLGHIAECVPPDCEVSLGADIVAAELGSLMQSAFPQKALPLHTRELSTSAKELILQKRYISQQIRQLKTLRTQACQMNFNNIGISIEEQCNQHERYLKYLTRSVTKQVRLDDNAFYNRLSDELCTASQANDSKTAHRIQRRLCNFKHIALTNLKSEEGVIANSPLCARQFFQDRLAKITVGDLIEPNDLINQYNSSSYPITQDEAIQVFTMLPSVGDLVQVCGSFRNGRAGGKDGCPPDLAKKYRTEVANIYHPIICNSMIQFKEPIQWSGGIAHELVKGNKSGARVDHHRFVILQNTGGKIYHKYIRSMLLSYIPTYLLQSMCGGFCSRGTDFASLYLSAFLSIASALKKHWAVLFLDVIAAFEAMQRFFVFGEQISDIEAHRIFSKLGFKEEALLEFMNCLNSPHAFKQAGIPSVLSKLVGSIHQNNWYATEGLEKLTTSTQGARAGTPLGDISFAFLIARVLRRCHSKIADADLCFKHVCTTNTSLFGNHIHKPICISSVNYVDDCLFPLVESSPSKLIASAKKLSSIVLDSFACFLLKCSFAPDKTAILCSIRNKDPSGAGLTRLGFRDFALTVSTLSYGTCNIPIIQQYKHVGKIIQNDICDNVDICRATRTMQSKHIAMRQKILRNKKIPVHNKQVFASGILIASLLSNGALWHNITSSAMSKLDKAYSAVYRDLHDNYKTPTNMIVSNHYFYQYHNINHVSTTLVFKRLNLFARVLVDAPPELLCLLAASAIEGARSWANQVVVDISHIYKLALFPLLPDPMTEPLAWFTFVQNKPRVFKKALYEYKDMVAGEIPHVAPSLDIVRTELTACTMCNKTLPHYKLSSHMFSKHGIKNNIRKHISGTVCICCMKDFHTRKKIVHHVSFRSPKCKTYWLSRDPIPQEDYCRLESESTSLVKHLNHIGRSALYSDSRPCRITGPLQHFPTQ